MKDLLNTINIEIKAELKYKEDAKRLNPQFKSRCGNIRLKNLRVLKKIINIIIKYPNEALTPEISSALIKILDQTRTNFIESIKKMGENPKNELEKHIAEKLLKMENPINEFTYTN